MRLDHRSATSDDISLIAQLVTAEDLMNLWPGRESNLDVVQALKRVQERSTLFVVESDGHLQAMYLEELWWLALWVRPETRRAGVGSAIVRAILSRNEEPAFVVEIRADNLFAQKFWMATGFVESKRHDQNGVAMIEARHDPSGLLAEIDEVFGAELARRAPKSR